jgi:flagellar basal body P-ring formation protein FlgA
MFHLVPGSSLRAFAAQGLLLMTSLGLPASAAWAAAPSVEKQVQAEARRVLEDAADRAGLAEPLFDLTLVKTARAVPACAKEVAVEGVDTRHPTRMRMAAICPGDDGWRQEFIVRASVSAKVLVAAADVPANRPLTDNDVMLDRRDVSAAPDALSDPDAIDGMSSRRALRSGDVLRRNALVAATLVKRGDSVRIVASSGQIEVTVAGEALESGGRDAIVKVRNTGNGNVIRARVVSQGTVQPVDRVVSTPAHSPD